MNNELNENDLLLLSSIAETFKMVRKQEGLTQYQAAKMGDSCQARVSSLERGQRDVLVCTLERWANVYGYTIEISLVPREENTPSSESAQEPETEPSL